MDLVLDGKHALVCGGSAGIGAAIAHELATLGADVTLLARRAAALERICAALPCTPGQRHGWIAADLDDTARTRAQVEALAAGRDVQIVIHNTGGPAPGAIADADGEAFAAAMRRHLLGAQAITQAVLPSMRRAGWGRIVSVLSTSVREPIPGLGVSNTVRAAMAAWGKTLSRELAPIGITVNSVLPGYTRTARLAQLIRERARTGDTDEVSVTRGLESGIPAGRFGEPGEIAAVAAFLCTPAAAYVTGVSLAADGGRMLAL
jgi:3-oxoacyl-[acyl-carrier protein] reductase